MEQINGSFTKFVNRAKEFIYSQEDLRSYEDFRKLSNSFKGSGVVYFIFVVEKNTPSLKYIGKSKGELFKQRIKNHFEGANEKTGTMHKKIVEEAAKNNKVLISYLLTNPESLRNLIEEELIKDCSSNLWNRRKMV
jgi:hypothetical protein